MWTEAGRQQTKILVIFIYWRVVLFILNFCVIFASGDHSEPPDRGQHASIKGVEWCAQKHTEAWRLGGGQQQPCSAAPSELSAVSSGQLLCVLVFMWPVTIRKQLQIERHSAK